MFCLNVMMSATEILECQVPICKRYKTVDARPTGEIKTCNHSSKQIKKHST